MPYLHKAPDVASRDRLGSQLDEVQPKARCSPPRAALGVLLVVDFASP